MLNYKLKKNGLFCFPQAFLQAFHRRPFRNLAEVIAYDGVIDDQIDFIDCTGTRYNVTPLIIAAGKGSFEKTKILLVHGANPNKQCSTGFVEQKQTIDSIVFFCFLLVIQL